MKKKKSVLFISSSQHFIEMFLKDFFLHLSDDYKINLITNISSLSTIPDKVNSYHVKINRKINLINDFLSTIKVLIVSFKIKSNYIVTVTPKCVIFGSLIKLFFPKVIRLHIYTGITWSNMKGIKKKLFLIIDKINVSLSNKVIFDSKEQMQYLSENGFDASKFYLINNGSIKGVDTNIFFKYDFDKKISLRKKYKIFPNQKVILYMGRMDINKGILDLLDSFKILSKKYKNTLLMLVGRDEINLNKYLNKYYSEDIKKIFYLRHNNTPQDIYNLADIFCLPSKREGFGNVVIEASAVELPVIGSNIFGLKSSLVNELNGLIFEIGKIDDLTKKLIYLIENEDVRERLGKNGREYVKNNFNPNDINKSLEKLIFN